VNGKTPEFLEISIDYMHEQYKVEKANRKCHPSSASVVMVIYFALEENL